MKKRILPLLLVLALSLTLTALPVSAGDGYQVRYKDAADVLWEMGLFQGSGTSFALDKPLDRASGITLLVRVLGKETEAKAGNWTTPFTDVPDWAKPYVGYAYVNGLTTGTSATTFSPAAGMNGKQFLTLILRALGYDDKAGDFSYLEAEKKALDVGLIDETDYKAYTASDDFRRDDAAHISAVALWTAKKGTSTPLKDTFTAPGKPSGAVPYATDAEAEAAKSGSTSQPQDDLAPYDLSFNGTQVTAVSAYVEQPTAFIAWLPIEYIARANGCTTSYDAAADGGKLTVKVNSRQSWSYTVNGNSLKIISNTLCIQNTGSVWEAMGLTVAVDKGAKTVNLTGDLSKTVAANWNSLGTGVGSGGSNSGGGSTAPGACSVCGGSGRVFCVSCVGMGTKSSTGMRYNPITNLYESYTTYTSCSACGGSGRALCTACGGSGHK